MLASGVWLPGMRTGWVWRHGRRTVRGHPRSPHISKAIISVTVQLWICVLGYIGIVQHKEYFPEVLSIPPGAPCILPFWAFVACSRVNFIWTVGLLVNLRASAAPRFPAGSSLLDTDRRHFISIRSLEETQTERHRQISPKRQYSHEAVLPRIRYFSQIHLLISPHASNLRIYNKSWAGESVHIET